MLLCGSCNRAKSWSCEHCENWRSIYDSGTCLTSMWGSPERYSHIALDERRWIQINWNGSESTAYERLRQEALNLGISLEDYIKTIIERQ